MPPFTAETFNAERLDIFYRNTLARYGNVIFTGGGELIRALATLFRLSGDTRCSQRIYLCEMGETEIMCRLYDRLPADNTVLVILSRKFDEMELLALSLAYSAWPQVFLAPTHGPLAEGARLLRIPFFPVDLAFNRFWYNSELFHLPLTTLGHEPEAISEGFIQGYRECIDGSRTVAGILRTMEKQGCWRVFFLSRNPFFRLIVEILTPLLEESSTGEKCRLYYRVLSPDTLKEHYLDELCRNPAETLCLWLDEGQRPAGPQISFPEILRENSYLDSRFFALQGKPFSGLACAESESLRAFLVEKRMTVVALSGFREDDESLGGLLAFFQLLACFNAWLRGVDLFNDPSRVEADGKAWDHFFWNIGVPG
ncbi:MAG TPA: hypothetical protein VLH40_01625 [Atribacteraceae bacterium]|nr:hypothetical protein [Atribacteraceae bacterium]